MKMTVLVVDGSKNVCKNAVDSLRQMGEFEIMETGSSEETISRFQPTRNCRNRQAMWRVVNGVPIQT